MCAREMLFKTFNHFIHSVLFFFVTFLFFYFHSNSDFVSCCFFFFSNPIHLLFHLHGLSKVDVFFSLSLFFVRTFNWTLKHHFKYYSFCKFDFCRLCACACVCWNFSPIFHLIRPHSFIAKTAGSMCQKFLLANFRAHANELKCITY